MSETKTFTASIDRIDEKLINDTPSFYEHIVNQMARNLSDLIASRIMDGEEYIVMMTPVRFENESENCVSVKRELVMKKLVRCENCEHWEYDVIFDDGWCRGKKQGNPDWFCADGIRKEQNGEQIDTNRECEQGHTKSI